MTWVIIPCSGDQQGLIEKGVRVAAVPALDRADPLQLSPYVPLRPGCCVLEPDAILGTGLVGYLGSLFGTGFSPDTC